jgi:hypothetical protein
MRIIIALLAIAGAVIIVAMTIAPTQPAVRDWYVETACPVLDMISRDICGPVRRAAGEKTP